MSHALDPASLAVLEVPLPSPGPGQVRIRVRAAGVNRADLMQRAGLYPPPPGVSATLGLEVSGEVEEVGPDVTSRRVGDRVVALLAGGGYATHVVCRADHTLPLPARCDHDEGAAFIEVFATAWLNLVRLGQLKPGERALLHAGASGVGTAAIQVCKLIGARSFVVVGDPSKVDACVALGADGGAVRHAGPWLPAVRAWAPNGVHVILDPVGATTLDDDLQALCTDGRLVLIGLLGGRTASIDLGRVLIKRIQLLGSTLRSRTDADKAALLEGLAQHVLPAWGAGDLRPVLDSTWPWTEAALAHARLATNQTVGALVLRVP